MAVHAIPYFLRSLLAGKPSVESATERRSGPVRYMLLLASHEKDSPPIDIQNLDAA
jgi:hypothetical protein